MQVTTTLDWENADYAKYLEKPKEADANKRFRNSQKKAEKS